MANKNFVVHNGLEVGPVKIFAGNGEILTSGNISSTSTTSITTSYIQKIGLQFPSALGSPTWYKIGTFSVNSGVGAGETVEFTLVAGQGYAAESLVKDIVEIRFLNGGSTNVESNYYSLGYREGVQGVKVKSVDGLGTGTSWDVYFYLGSDLGKGYVELKLSADAKFTWINTSDSDPGSAAANLHRGLLQCSVSPCPAANRHPCPSGPAPALQVAAICQTPMITLPEPCVARNTSMSPLPSICGPAAHCLTRPSLRAFTLASRSSRVSPGLSPRRRAA